MLLIEGPSKTITTTYRRRSKSRLAFILYCLRHPVLAFVTWRQMSQEPLLNERQRGLLLLALIHGIVATWLT